MDWGTLLAAIIGIASTAIILVLKAQLEARKEEQRTRRTTSLEDRERRIETDRAMYGRRLTTLVQLNLATFIRSGKWWTDEEDLRRLVLSLEQGTYENFVDPAVSATWVKLVATTIVLARKRLAGTITPEDIQEYNEIHRAWEDAAKRSFGPLPETAEIAPRTDRARSRDRRAIP